MADTVHFGDGSQVTRSYAGNRRFRYEVFGFSTTGRARDGVALYPSDEDRAKLIELLGGTPKPCPETCACGCQCPCVRMLPDHYDEHSTVDDHWMTKEFAGK